MRTLQIRKSPHHFNILPKMKAHQNGSCSPQQIIAEFGQALQPMAVEQGIKRLQTLRKLRTEAPRQPLSQDLAEQLERWQREDRDR